MVKIAAEQKQFVGRGGEKSEKVEPALMSFWNQSYPGSVFSNTGSLLIIYASRFKEA